MPAKPATAKRARPRTRANRVWPAIRSRVARWSSQPLSAMASSFLIGFLKIAFVAILPFVVGVRAAVYFYLRGATTWLAMLLAAIILIGFVAAYAAALSHRFTGRARVAELTKWVAAPLVGAWCAYALLYLASANAKSDAIRLSYHSLHPVLRFALATVILADEQLVVTDLIRAPDDYARMGRPPATRSMHYRQADGWVHAVDLRTTGHGELRNRTLQFYFWVTGLSTLRHVGTADHLHVQLALPRA